MTSVQLISFTFDKISAEKKKPLKAPLQVKTHIKILNLQKEEIPIHADKKEKILQFTFEYLVDYQETDGAVALRGNVLCSGKKDDIENVFATWQKTKKIEPEISKLVLNNILIKCNIKALAIEQDVGLPPHVVLPMLKPVPKKKSKAEEYIG